MTDSNNPELQSDEQAPVVKTSADASPDNAALMRRRNLLKTGIVAVPAVMTLHNGAARAAIISNCDVTDQTPNGSCWTSLNPGDQLTTDTSSMDGDAFLIDTEPSDTGPPRGRDNNKGGRWKGTG